MVLSNIAICALRGLNQETKKALATELNTRPRTFYRWLGENFNNGPLTTVAALKLIAKEFGLPETLAEVLLLDGGPDMSHEELMQERFDRLADRLGELSQKLNAK